MPITSPPAEEFARVWNDAPSLRAAAERLGCTPPTASSRAMRLRKSGHALKRFPKLGERSRRTHGSVVDPERRGPDAA